jgi:hypothetical protein
MAVRVNVKRTFNVDGKEYSSIDEMPEGIREAVRKAMASGAEPGRGNGSPATHTKVVFNGTEYPGIDAMPRDVRQLYETVLSAAEAEGALPGIGSAEPGRGLLRQSAGARDARPGDVPPPTQFESAFSSRMMTVSVLLIGLLLLMYYVWQVR